MATREQIYKATILINSEQAQNNIKKLETQLEEVKKRRDKALVEGKIDVWKATNKEIDSINKKLEKQRSIVMAQSKTIENISTAKAKELKNLIGQINKELDSPHIKKGSEEWKALVAVLKDAKTELKELSEDTREQESSWSKFTGFLNKNWGAITQIAGAITGISTTVRSAVQDYADMEEEMADVRKYTGLDIEVVRELNEEFKHMDTRTAREKLNQLAGAAGRLGKQSKEDVLEFVEAADMIGIALGDDLGDGAVDKIGKLAMAFGEDKNKGLKGAMLATGSAINELAQNSSAQAGYLVEFTARVAGFGKQLGLTQAQIMGFGTVMDENLLKDEMAATAFGNMLTKMQTDTATFAKIAGQSVEEFTKLMREDANAAVLAVADSLRKQDPTTMMKMLDSMGLDGSRAVGVLSTLADKIDDVRKHQERATEAYEKATSVVDEFGTMNNTVQAKMDKCKKAFKEMAIDLGEQLLPVVKFTVTTTGLLTKALSVLVSFVSNNKLLIVTLTGYIIALNAAKLKKIVIDKLEYFWSEKLKKAFQSLWTTVRAHPYAALIAAVTILIGKYIQWAKSTDEATRKQKALLEVEQEAARIYGEEKNKIDALRKIVEDANESIDNRREAIKELQKIVPDYHASLTAEGELINSNADALDTYCQKLKLAAQIQAASGKLTTAQEELRRFEMDVSQSDGMTKAMWNEKVEGMSENEAIAAAQANPSAYRAVKAKLARLEADVRMYEQMIEDYTKQMNAISANQSSGGGGGGGGGTGGTGDEKDPLKKKEKELKEYYERRQIEELLAYRRGEKSYSDYQESINALTKESFEKRKKIYEDANEKERQEYWNLLKEESDWFDSQTKDTIKKRDTELLRDRELQAVLIRRQYNDVNSQIYQDEKALNQALFENDREYLRLRIENAVEGSKEWIELSQQLQDLEERNRLQLAEDYEKQIKQMRSSYARMSAQKQMEAELAGLKLLYESKMNQGRISEEQYQQMIQQIREKYAKNIKEEQDERIHKGDKQQSKGASIADGVFNVLTIADNYKLEMEAIDQMLADHTINEQEAADKRRQIWGESMEAIAAAASTAFQGINQMMSAASSYAQACSDLEVARITANYDRQIEAAGKNSHQREKLEKQRDEAIAKAKTKANKKAMAMEMAQAIAQTAMGAISAYSSTMAGAPYPANLVLAPISAGIALAAGALQIATIKKQHEAEAAGYYEGGFTGGSRYRKEAGVVHEGEFVANHQAVNNPQLMPVLSLIDQAQRSNRVASLRAEDVTNVMGAGAGASPSGVIAPIVNVQTDNEELRQAVEAHREATELLLQRLEQPINAQVVLTGPDGLNAQQQRLDAMMKNK